MNRSSLALTILATLSALAVSAPAHATDGRTAVGLCIDRGPACSWTADAAGGVDIFVDGHWISCPAADKPCVLMYRTGGKSTDIKGASALLAKAR